VFTPPETVVCLGATVAAGHCSKPGSTEPLCSYHSFTTVNSSTVLYAVLPTTQITACQDDKSLELVNHIPAYVVPAEVTVNEIADEQIATATDPQFNGWHGPSGEEVPDKCRYDFLPLNPGGKSPGEFWNNTIGDYHFYLNDEFNQAGLTEGFPGSHCLNTVTEEPQFTAPTTVHPGDPVTFNATASYVDLGIAKYNWEFGPGETAEVNCEGRTPTDGKTPAECNTALGTGNPNSVASVVHKYAHSGSYEVKLTVIDDGGNSAVATHTITVVPTQQEEEEAKATREAEAKATREAGEKATREAGEKAKREAEEQGKSPAAVESAKRAAEAKAGVPPVATAAISSTSLKTALSKGLTIRYSVSEQVTGHFEVLLAASISKRIGLHGALATGLAPGTAPQIVIAKALLVTTKAGHNTVKIQLGKKTAKLLRKLKKVSLMVRLVVRNGTSGAAASTSTAVSVVTLTH
jgi:PKD repeat protein